MGLLLIMRFTLKEAIRRRIFLAVIVLSLIAVVGFTVLFSILLFYSSAPAYIDMQTFLLGVGGFMTVLTTWLVYLLASVMTILLTTNMISGELDAGTFVIIVPKPLRRYEIVFGKWLCYAILLGLYTALLTLLFWGIIYWKTGYWPSDMLDALGLLELVVLVLLGITTLGSSLVPTLVNGAIVLILFISAQISSFVQLIIPYVAPTHQDAVQNVTTIINLLIPTDALWHGSSFYLTSGALDLIQAARVNTPFTATSPIANALIVWAILYCLILPTLAAWCFQRRDL